MEMQNSFAAGCGGGWRRAEIKRECESVKCERAELAFTHFLRGSGLFGALQAAGRHPSCMTSAQ